MKLKCDAFFPLTHPTYGEAGCYGCIHADIGINFVSCAKSHWCMPMFVPVMEKGSISFMCSSYKKDGLEGLLLCDDCSLFNTYEEVCRVDKKIREIAVRFD